MLRYYIRLFRRATNETLLFFSWERSGPFWSKISLSIVSIALLVIVGWFSVAFSLLIAGLAAIVAGACSFPVVFVWKLMVAAHLLDDELSTEIEALKKPANKFDEDVAKRLEELIDEGNNLRTRQTFLSMGTTYEEWLDELIAWCETAEQLLEDKLPRAEAFAFKSISEYPDKRHAGNQLRQILDARFQKLRLISMRYMGNAPAE